MVYTFFWEIFGGKSYAAACACADIVVPRSPPPWVNSVFRRRVPFKIEIVYSVIPKPE